MGVATRAADVSPMEMKSLRDDRVGSRDPRTRVLLVDDDTGRSHRHRRVLECAGYECFEAGGGQEARRCLLADDIALLVVDAGIAREAGLELAWHVLANYPAIPVIVTTVVDDAGLDEGALSFGACGYLARPFTPRELTAVVANALCRRGVEIERRAQRQLSNDLARAVRA
jgi:DNA-binding response OmpR family regulator